MRTIFRYEVPLFDTVSFEMTGDPLHVGVNPITRNLEFWSENDSEAPTRTRSFTGISTGHDIQSGMKYIGTAPRTDSGFVWHLYEV